MTLQVNGPRVLVLGAGLLHREHYRIIRAMGCFAIGMDRDPKAPAKKQADLFFAIEPTNTQQVVSVARKCAVNAIIPLSEFGVLPAAIASEKLGLNFITPETARKSHDKVLMRKTWLDNRIEQPAFYVVSSIEEAFDAAAELGYPLIVKHRALSGARGIRRVHNDKQLANAYSSATFSYSENTVLLEECIDGIETSVEGVVIDNKVIVLAYGDKVIREHKNFCVTRSINYPGAFNETQISAIKNVTDRCIQALGLNNSPFHLEVFVIGNKVIPLECGARGGGGHIFSHVVKEVCGVDLVKTTVQLLLGENPTITSSNFPNGACYRFIFPPQGRLILVSGTNKVSRDPKVLALIISVKPGAVIQEPEHGPMRAACLLTKGANRNEALEVANWAENQLQWAIV